MNGVDLVWLATAVRQGNLVSLALANEAGLLIVDHGLLFVDGLELSVLPILLINITMLVQVLFREYILGCKRIVVLLGMLCHVPIDVCLHLEEQDKG